MMASTSQATQGTVPQVPCILHLGSDNDSSTVKPFGQDTWSKVQEAVELRLTQRKSSKYTELCTKLKQMEFTSLNGYHKKCYSNFTSIPKSQTVKAEDSSQDDVPFLRSSSMMKPKTTSGIFPQVCLFCGSARKTVKMTREDLGSCESFNAQEKIKAAAVALGDHQMLTKITDVDFMAKEVKYHHSCRKQYLNSAERSDSSKSPGTASIKSLHEKAFENICDHINENLVQGCCAELLTSLHSRYLRILTEHGEFDSPYTAQKLSEKLRTFYGDSLCFSKFSNKGLIVYPKGMEKMEAISQAFSNTVCPKSAIVEAALNLRCQILQLQSTARYLPETLGVEQISKGEADPTEDLLLFFRMLYTGTYTNKPLSERVERYIKSSADDAIFATTRGKLKPAKHLGIGLGIKSMTGSRKVLNILNHFGHSISYHVAESLETSLATSIAKQNKTTPDGIALVPGMSTGTAWDNYDENTETLSGKDTLHDTVGICFQNTPEEHIQTADVTMLEPSTATATAIQPTSSSDIQQTKQMATNKRKRTFDFELPEIDPYPKKPKIQAFDYDVKEVPKPPNLEQLKRRDICWMMSSLCCKNIPMWSGWNSRITKDDLPPQTVSYMANLSLPPTRLDVVNKTLQLSQEVAKECGDRYAVVTYDLAIAKPALQIQSQESPYYDNVFVCFGAFHIMNAYFASLGHYIEESGGPHILVDTGVLASGSLPGFISGKHFNRCQRLHILLATAFNILHFDAFLGQYGNISESLKQALKNVNSPTELENLENNPDYISIVAAYEQYTEDTRSGKHGPTAAYWVQYTDLVHKFMLFSRACRTNDLPLFSYSLRQMCGMFFAAGRHNYAKWMVKYSLNLANIDHTHPGLRSSLENGGLSIRRSNNPFARNPVDMTLEQTVNADAASRLTGISAFTQSLSARRKWMLTRAVRSAIVGDLQKKAGLGRIDNVSQENKPYRIKRDNADLENLKNGIESTMNPFSEAVQSDDKLYCISTGKAVNDEIKQNLLECSETGEAWCKEFTAECFADHSRFEKSLSRRKTKNFAAAALKVKVTAKDMQIKELQGTRDLFGRLLYLAVTNKVDLSIVFQYPLTPVPFALAHVDGSMMKTDKSQLMHHLEKKIESSSPNRDSIDICVVDGMFLLHILQNVPATYGGMANTILEYLCAQAKQIDFICDTYKHPSIKDVERERRGDQQGMAPFAVTGPEQHRPVEYQKALRSNQFKTSLLTFLSVEWMKDHYAHILRGHKLYFTLGTECYLFEENSGTVTRKIVPDLHCQHEEADTRVVWHIQHATMEKSNLQVVVRSNDTDVLIVLLHHMHRLQCSLWMDVGLSGKNTRRYIDVTGLASNLGRSICDALPALHAFTGCDFTASFLRKGKVKPFELMAKSKVFQEAFAQLGSDELDDAVIDVIEQFVCAMYGKPRISSVNEARHDIFCSKYKPNQENHPLQRIKGCDASLLPPCQSVLANKVKRTNFVAHVWKSAHKSNTTTMEPENSGWHLVQQEYAINWFEGEQIPQNVCIGVHDVEDESNLDDLSDSSSEESDCDSD